MMRKCCVLCSMMQSMVQCTQLHFVGYLILTLFQVFAIHATYIHALVIWDTVSGFPMQLHIQLTGDFFI